jgi:ethanolamine ammonia-lyase large subunit
LIAPGLPDRRGLAADGVEAMAAIGAAYPGEDVFHFVRRLRGEHDAELYAQILGAANEFKDGDRIVGVAAAMRQRNARACSRTRGWRTSTRSHIIRMRCSVSFPRDETRARKIGWPNRPWPSSNSSCWIPTQARSTDHARHSATRSPVVLMTATNSYRDRTASIHCRKRSVPGLPGRGSGSPTNNVEDIRCESGGWSCGEDVLSNNPVSSDPAGCRDRANLDLLTTFGVDSRMPRRARTRRPVVERRWPGSTALWFQSIAGSDTANETFDVSVEKLKRYADTRTGPYGLYFETGQGADFTNGHGHGFDMVLHESRKYGLARALTGRVAQAKRAAGNPAGAWVHLNDVAGFIGPEVFRTREQLVRCCLEDIAMGKLHGLCIGLDVCATLHMDISLDDLDWPRPILHSNPAHSGAADQDRPDARI